MTGPRPTLIVTGASGFVGRHLIDFAAGSGWTVRALSRSASPINSAADWHTLADYAADNAVARETWKRIALPKEGLAPVLIHLAARAHRPDRDQRQSPELYRQANVHLTIALARVAFRYGIKRIVFLSSVGAVAERSAPGHPLNESSPCEPRTVYGYSKLEAEIALRKLAEVASGEVVTVRAPLVHGPGAPGNLAKMARWLRTGIPLPFRGVRNARSLVHVRNLAELLVCCAMEPAAANRTYHVRDPKDLSTPEILREAARALGLTPRLFSVPTPLLRAMAASAGQRALFDRLCGTLQVDDSLARRELGWRPYAYPIQV